MNELTSMLIPALGSALLHFLWQGALLGLLAGVALALLRNARAQVRYAAACIAMFASLLLPALTLAWLLASADAPAASLPVLVAADPEPRRSTGSSCSGRRARPSCSCACPAACGGYVDCNDRRGQRMAGVGRPGMLPSA